MGQASTTLAHYNNHCCRGMQNKESQIMTEIKREQSIIPKSKPKRTRKKSVRNKKHRRPHPSSLQQSTTPSPTVAYAGEEGLSLENMRWGIPSIETTKSYDKHVVHSIKHKVVARGDSNIDITRSPKSSNSNTSDDWPCKDPFKKPCITVVSL